MEVETSVDCFNGMSGKAVVGVDECGANRMSCEAVMGVEVSVNGADRMSCEAVVGVEASGLRPRDEGLGRHGSGQRGQLQ